MERIETYRPRYDFTDPTELPLIGANRKITVPSPATIFRSRSSVVIGLGVSAFCLIGVAAIILLAGDALAFFGIAVIGLTAIFLSSASWSPTATGIRRQPHSKALPSVDLSDVFYGLAEIVEVRDNEVLGHSQRVAANAVTVGRELGLTEVELVAVYWGGLLHDVGKIAVPESLLSKAGRLTDEDLEEIRKHPSYGARLLKGLSAEIPEITNAVHFHHERWDGLGYPFGIQGDAIPQSARIIAVVDVFEALTSHRPYRAALTVEQAALYIRRGAGAHFEPAIVNAFQSLLLDNKLIISRDATTGKVHDCHTVQSTRPL